MEPSSEVKAAYVRVTQAMSGGDIATFMACISREPGALLIGTAPDEWFAGPAAIERVAERVLPALHRAGLACQPGDAQAFREGNIGWVADRLTLRLPDGPSQELRVVAIFRREDGQWKLVTYSHSIGIPDAQVEVFQCFVPEPGQ
jgi:ketosteroid isomerase-like protein